MSSALARQMEGGFGVVRQRAIRRYLRIHVSQFSSRESMGLGVLCDRCGVRVAGGVQGLQAHIRDRRCEVGCMERVADMRWACMVCDFKARTQTSAYNHATAGCLENLFHALIPPSTSVEGGEGGVVTGERGDGGEVELGEYEYEVDSDEEEAESDLGGGGDDEVEWNETGSAIDTNDTSFIMDVDDEEEGSRVEGGGKVGLDPAAFDSRFVDFVHRKKGSSREGKVYDQNLLDMLMIADSFMKCGVSIRHAMFIVKVFKSIGGRESSRIRSLPVDWRTYIKKINTASASDRGGKKKMGGQIYSVGVPRWFNYKYDSVNFMCRDFYSVVKELLIDSNLVKHGKIKFDYDPQGKPKGRDRM